MVGTSAARVLRMIATDRMQAARIATGGKDAHVVPRVYGRVGYDVPVAQSAVPLYVHFKFQRMISQVTSRMNIASL